MRRVTKLENIRDKRVGSLTGHITDYKLEESRDLADELYNRLDYPTRRMTRFIGMGVVPAITLIVDVNGTDVCITSLVKEEYIEIEFRCFESGVDFSISWAFDGDITDSDINEIVREVTNSLSDLTIDDYSDVMEKMFRDSKLMKSFIREVKASFGESVELDFSVVRIPRSKGKYSYKVRAEAGPKFSFDLPYTMSWGNEDQYPNLKLGFKKVFKSLEEYKMYLDKLTIDDYSSRFTCKFGKGEDPITGNWVGFANY